jgi:small subunit ribosomal protein S15
VNSTHREQKNKMSEQVKKQNIIEENRSHEKDTGSSEVQIALLSARISHLNRTS